MNPDVFSNSYGAKSSNDQYLLFYTSLCGGKCTIKNIDRGRAIQLYDKFAELVDMKAIKECRLMRNGGIVAIKNRKEDW